MDSYHVNCASKDRGKEVKEVCRVGCIGCGLCIKQCEYGAIRLEEQCAIINPKLCVGCGKCSSKCPTQAISHLIGEGTQEKDKFAIAKRD